MNPRIAPLLLLLGLSACETEADFSVSTSTDSTKREPVLDVPSPSSSLAGSMTFIQPGDKKTVAAAAELPQVYPQKRIETNDPNYKAVKTFIAIPLAEVLKDQFPADAFKPGVKFLLTASDGYSVEAPAEQLVSGDAFLAIGEKNVGVFSPIGEQGVDPGPFYLIWKGQERTDEKQFPRPWALVSIEQLDSSDRHAHTRPQEGFGENAAAKKGYEIFSAACIRCHAINREGGRVGPDLNVPQNILSYRPEAQVRAYIRDPKTFRYSNMPAHPQFQEQDIDALVAYLRLMGSHQHDPETK